MATKWKRPDSVPLQKWYEFEGKKEVNGVKRKYWVQDVTENEYEDVVHHMTTGFLGDEILCKYTNLKDDKESLDDIKALYYEVLKEKTALVCLTKGEDGKNIIAGMNVTLVSQRDYKEDFKPKGKAWQIVFNTVMYVSYYKDVFSTFDGDCYLTALGLYVLPGFRGEGLGTEILKAREPLCRALGIKATATVFTSWISQKTAKYAGFEEFTEIDYDDIAKAKPDCVIPKVTEHTKSCKCMVLVFK